MKSRHVFTLIVLALLGFGASSPVNAQAAQAAKALKPVVQKYGTRAVVAAKPVIKKAGKVAVGVVKETFSGPKTAYAPSGPITPRRASPVRVRNRRN